MNETRFSSAFAQLKGVQMTTPRSIRILKESLDKRKGLRYVYTVEVEVGEMVNVERMVQENKGMHIRQVEAATPVPLSECPAL